MSVFVEETMLHFAVKGLLIYTVVQKISSLFVCISGNSILLGLCQKRWTQMPAGKTMLEKLVAILR